MKVELIDHMGTDLSVVNAARVSFDKKSEWVVMEPGGFLFLRNEDERLIRYLAKHDHWTPFAHTAISLRVGAPVPIRTQCFKHKQGLVENEESRRYIKSTPELYIPDVWRKAAENVKQGSGDDFDTYDSERFTQAYLEAARGSIYTYEYLLGAGVCPEQARFVLPQGCMVNWIWTGNLYAFANFYLKRTDPHAQKEVQMVAEMVGKIIEPLFPVSWAALTETA